jgi:hypothetical protein
MMPAGPTGRYLVTVAGTRLVTGDGGLDDEVEWVRVAVDLVGRAPEAAVARGEAAMDRLPGTLLRLGGARISAGGATDPAFVVPEYVSLPRGAAGAPGGEVVTTWSPAHP